MVAVGLAVGDRDEPDSGGAQPLADAQLLVQVVSVSGGLVPWPRAT